MGLEIEMEEGEGEVVMGGGDEGAAADQGADADKEEADDAEEELQKQDEDEDFDPAADLDKPESPQKKSAFKRGVNGGMKKAMGKVKILAFEMKKYKLTGTIGVGFEITMFGTGIEVEFEINLTSCITDTEFEEMLKHEDELKERKKEKKKAKKGGSSQLQTSRRDSASVGSP
jgi:hypothetical protein